MCKPGNGSIYRECRDRLRSEHLRRLSNREMREMIVANGGCMTTIGQQALLDTRSGAVVKVR